MNITWKQSHSESYKAAGVDVTAGYRAVELMKQHVERTSTPGVLSHLGEFGGLFRPNLNGVKDPVLASSTDGVGTKLRIAFLMDKHDTIGIDCVAMCVNDIICVGAAPIFFLDYIAASKIIPEKIEQIISGVAEGCVQAGCALVGGETAEMPSFYADDEYDLVGFSVGIADSGRIPSKDSVAAGDVILALPSTGLHSNGFSLARKVLDVERSDRLDEYIPELGKTIGEEILTPTKIYVKPVLELFGKVKLRSLCNITGGGFYENIPRGLPVGMSAVIEKSLIKIPPVFNLIASAGGVAEHDMFNTFNMGVGMCAIVAKEDADKAISILRENGVDAYPIGTAQPGEDEVSLR